VTVAELKKGVPSTVFTVGGGGAGDASLRRPVCRVEAGGSSEKRNRLFVARGTGVWGYDRKGKEFFCMETTMTSPIRAMRVGETHIWAAADTA
jgi:hypothetical protein